MSNFYYSEYITLITFYVEMKQFNMIFMNNEIMFNLMKV